MAAEIARNPRPPSKPESQLTDALHAAHITRHLLQPTERVEMWPFNQVRNGAKNKNKCNGWHDRANDLVEHLPYTAENGSTAGPFHNRNENQQQHDRSHHPHEGELGRNDHRHWAAGWLQGGRQSCHYVARLLQPLALRNDSPNDAPSGKRQRVYRDLQELSFAARDTPNSAAGKIANHDFRAGIVSQSITGWRYGANKPAS